MTSREIEYEADGGIVMVGHLAVPEGEGVRPAVLVAHEAPGLDVLLAEPHVDPHGSPPSATASAARSCSSWSGAVPT